MCDNALTVRASALKSIQVLFSFASVADTINLSANSYDLLSKELSKDAVR
jgi:hypothetical protein